MAYYTENLKEQISTISNIMNWYSKYNIDTKIKNSKIKDKCEKFGHFAGSLLNVWEHERATGSADSILYLDLIGGFTDVYIFTSSCKFVMYALHCTYIQPK